MFNKDVSVYTHFLLRYQTIKMITVIYKILHRYDRGAQIFHKSRNHFQITGARRVTQSNFHTEDP